MVPLAMAQLIPALTALVSLAPAVIRIMIGMVMAPSVTAVIICTTFIT